jgi:CRP/FNR family transcriptional regulator, anaerobic regulatory protein
MEQTHMDDVPCSACPLRKTAAFSPISADELVFIQSFKKDMMKVQAGGAIIAEGDNSETLMTLFAGFAFRFKTLSNGRRQILNFLLPGDFIGLQEKFADNSPHGVEAVTDAHLCVFYKNRLWDLYRAYPSLGYDITWLAAGEQTLIDDNLLSVGQRNAAERIAVLLIQLYRRAERLGLAESGTVPFPFTQQHLADALGLSLVHTNKTLRRLEQLGLHRIEQSRLSLPNPRALQRLADYYDLPLKVTPLV